MLDLAFFTRTNARHKHEMQKGELSFTVPASEQFVISTLYVTHYTAAILHQHHPRSFMSRRHISHHVSFLNIIISFHSAKPLQDLISPCIDCTPTFRNRYIRTRTRLLEIRVVATGSQECRMV